jgi:hypothetical protein
MNFLTPPGTYAISATAADNTTANSSYCSYSVTPEIIVTNNGGNTIDSADVTYTYNGVTSAPIMVSGIAVGASQTVTFPAITLSTTSGTIDFLVSADNYFTQLMLSGNATASSETFYTLSASAFDE